MYKTFRDTSPDLGEVIGEVQFTGGKKKNGYLARCLTERKYFAFGNSWDEAKDNLLTAIRKERRAEREKRAALETLNRDDPQASLDYRAPEHRPTGFITWIMSLWHRLFV